MYKRLTILTLVVIIFTTFMGTGANTESNLTTELKENLIPLKTVEAESGFEDLMPLKEILKDKRIIGMGEATHGTSEFFKMKHRMFEFLVEEMGYRVFAIEGEFGGSQVVNEYILYGKGDINKSLEAMNFWIWSTEEVVDMIEWMKKYNDDPNNKRKIKFYGFDIQSADNSLSYVLDYLEKVGSNNIDGYRKGIKTLEEIYAELKENKDEYIKNSSVEEYDLIFQHAVVIDQWIDLQRTKERFETRDHYMTENIKWILDYENKHYGNDKIMLWAHNGHISKEFIKLNIGKRLKDLYNDDYYSLGFDFYEGDFIAGTFTLLGSKGANFHISSSPNGSYGDEMNKTGIPISFLDFKKAEKNKVVSEFLSSKIYSNNIGALYLRKRGNENDINKKVMRDTYDGMIFINSTTASKMIKPYFDRVKDGNKILVYNRITILILALGIFIIPYKLYKKRKLSQKQ
ncbi:erythromycin esterase family protein [Tissierella pigra]|uniref:Erythromycin esterase family protein n=1 Tax=Tissierella pigra TaxID=2607614 RepID=A0A6N7XEJ6_9FIRM|nr:erythromycin esterase family protein [Tissierella pigra]MSU00409.1 erythromycin esterase family protein [Tissierella pigra]